MHIQMSILSPKPEFDREVVESMHRFERALVGAPGLISTQTARDADSGNLVGLVFWASEQSMRDSAHLAQSAIADDPFDLWLTREIQDLHLEPVTHDLGM